LIEEAVYRRAPDRARAAGWTLEIDYGNEGFPAIECVLGFKRPAGGPA
jgi:hypothetical protein